jgi:hypothetical protein
MTHPSHSAPTTGVPIACDMTTATDTDDERVAEYQRLFAQALVGRERTADGIRFRFRAADGVEAWVRDLAAREKACCPFFGYDIATRGDEVHWDATVVDDEIARAVLDEFYDLPDKSADGVDGFLDRLGDRGLEVVTSARDHGIVGVVMPDRSGSRPPTCP